MITKLTTQQLQMIAETIKNSRGYLEGEHEDYKTAEFDAEINGEEVVLSVEYKLIWNDFFEEYDGALINELIVQFEDAPYVAKLDEKIELETILIN